MRNIINIHSDVIILFKQMTGYQDEEIRSEHDEEKLDSDESPQLPEQVRVD